MTKSKMLRALPAAALVLFAGAVVADEATRQSAPAKTEATGETTPKKEVGSAEGHFEAPTPWSIPMTPRDRETSEPAEVIFGDYVSVQVNVDANGMNIVGDAANEPSIAVDPNDRNIKVIGWRQFDTISSDFRQAGYGYTTDGGDTWTFPGVIDPGVFRSDPVLDVDSDGVFYYNSLTAEGFDFWCRVFRSFDGGQTWDDGVYAEGGDKQWMAIDRSGGIGDGNIYANWNRIFSICDGDMTRSYDGGDTFTDCISVPTAPRWGTTIVGPDGAVYVAGESFVVIKSSTLQDPVNPPQFDFSVDVDLGGFVQFSTGPNPGGLLGQAYIDVDRSGGPNHNNVYLVSSCDPPGSDPMDVKFARSTDGGQTWSDPVRINDDPVGNGAWQWFGTMSVAPNGRIDVIWNDTRNHPGTFISELFYSFSEDGGLTWSENVQITPEWDPHVGWPVQNKIGDYYHMRSDDLGADLAYSATFNGEQDVYYLRIGGSCSDAGEIDLDSPKYACESAAEVNVNDCGLNTDDEVIETVEITIASDSEPLGETLVLTETGPESADFLGTIALSETDGSGVLLVAPGDTVTATYIDEDNGEGGFDIEVTATAIVDCDAPTISNVMITNVGPRGATITFQTDEPARGTVRFGESCGELTGSEEGDGFVTDHEIVLTNLTDSTQYFLVVDAEDEAGNIVTDDNGGSCYSFITLDAPDVLLVDDDDNTPDVRSFYTDALDALGIFYDIWDTGNSDDEPSAAELAIYETVIWFTGDEFGGFAGPGPAGEGALGTWLDNGGCLLISSQDYHWDRDLTAFMQDYLGVQSVVDDESQTSVTGEGDVFGDLGTFSLSFPFSNFSDAISPNAEGALAFSGNQGDAAITKDGGVYRTAYLVFPIEAIANAADREATLLAFFDWCGGLFPDCPADIDGNGVVDVTDLLELLAAWGTNGGPADLNDDGIVDVTDLLQLLADWGPCA